MQIPAEITVLGWYEKNNYFDIDSLHSIGASLYKKVVGIKTAPF